MPFCVKTLRGRRGVADVARPRKHLDINTDKHLHEDQRPAVCSYMLLKSREQTNDEVAWPHFKSYDAQIFVKYVFWDVDYENNLRFLNFEFFRKLSKIFDFFLKRSHGFNFRLGSNPISYSDSTSPGASSCTKFWGGSSNIFFRIFEFLISKFFRGSSIAT